MTDPIEVLREAIDKLTRAACYVPADQRMAYHEASAAAERLLASLSAPKPERAEAVFNCPTCPVSVKSRWQEPECPECGERCYLDPTAAPAPPRPEAVDPDAYAIIDEFVQCANVGRSGGKLYRAAQDWLALADARRETHPAPPGDPQ